MRLVDDGQPAPGRRHGFFEALGRGVVRHPLAVIGAWAALIAVGYAIAAGAFFPVSSVIG